MKQEVSESISDLALKLAFDITVTMVLVGLTSIIGNKATSYMIGNKSGGASPPSQSIIIQPTVRRPCAYALVLRASFYTKWCTEYFIYPFVSSVLPFWLG